METTDWRLGIKAALAMSMIVVSLRAIRLEEIHWGGFTLAVSFYFFLGLLNWFILNRFLVTSQNGQKPTWWQPVGSTLSVIILQLVLDWAFSAYFDRILMLDAIGPTWYRLLVLRSVLVGVYYYFMIYHFSIKKQRQQNLIELTQLREAQLQASLSSLKEQLSPHFMFNTLNTLSSISQENEVKEYITELSNVYRYLLTFQKKDVVTVAEELAFVNSYLFIIKARMEDAIDITIHISERTRATQLPPLTLQLLLENAVKHNVASVAKPLQISLSDQEPGWLAVSNTFQPRSYTRPSTQTGLANIRDRYQRLLGKRISIEESDQFFTVKLPVIQP